MTENNPTTRAATLPNAFQRFMNNDIVKFIRSLIPLVILIVLFRSSVVQAFQIPSGSMIPTLKIKDYILVNKFAYGLRLPFMTNIALMYKTPARGDVVVFTRPDEISTPEDDSADYIIKRVIGLPGEIIQVRDAKVYINNLSYAEPYARWDLGGTPEGEFGPVTVPEGHILLLGDNRDHSKDSRFWEYHFLDVRRVQGKAMIVYMNLGPEFLSRIGTIIH